MGLRATEDRRPAVRSAAGGSGQGRRCWWQWPALLGVLAGGVAVELVRLNTLRLLEDESVYLYGGRLIARGAAPYRDFYLAHPPGLMLLAGGWFRLAGESLTGVRVAYLVLILAGTVPLYLLARSLSGRVSAGLIAVAAYTGGLSHPYGVSAVQLEPLMNVFLIGALAAIGLRPASGRMRALAGVLLAAALLVKFTAIVAVILMAASELLVRSGRRDTARRWAITASAMLAVLLPAALYLLLQPHFLDGVVRDQFARPRTPAGTRLLYLRNLTLHFPLYLGAFAIAVATVAGTRTPRLRAIALTGAVLTLVLIAGFRSYYNFYLMVALPWLAVPLGAAIGPLTEVRGRWAEPALTLLCLIGLGFAGPLLKATASQRAQNNPATSPAAIVERLRGGSGYLCANHPGFALVSGRTMYPWYYEADSYLPRLVGRIGDADFLGVVQSCAALVLWPDELEPYPLTRAYVEQHFTATVTTPSQVLWERARPALPEGD